MSKRRDSLRRRLPTGQQETGMMRWLLTYADLITLLLAFFIMMYAISSADQKKFQTLRTSLQSALHTGTTINGVLPYAGTQIIESAAEIELKQQERVSFKKIIKTVQDKTHNASNIAFILDGRGLTIRFLEEVLFDLGSADLRNDSRRLLAAVGQVLKENSFYIRVEGHADNLPINTEKYPSNWELSAARAIAVTRYLIEVQGFDPQRLSSLGYGEFRPLYNNINEQNRARNRRVDIVILHNQYAGSEKDEKTVSN